MPGREVISSLCMRGRSVDIAYEDFISLLLFTMLLYAVLGSDLGEKVSKEINELHVGLLCLHYKLLAQTKPTKLVLCSSHWHGYVIY